MIGIERSVRTVVEKAFDFLCHLSRLIHGCIVTSKSRTFSTPVMDKALEHSKWTQLIDFSESTKHGQFVVCHTHIHFVALHVCSSNGFKLCRGNGIEELFKARQVEVFLCPGDEPPEILLVNATNRVDIGTGAIIFGLVAS